MYGRSAPSPARRASRRRWRWSPTAPPPSNGRISWMSANRLFTPAWPPAPPPLRSARWRPSRSLLREALLMMSCSTMPPQPCTALVDVGARAQRGDDGTLQFRRRSPCRAQPVVRLVHDLVDANGAAGLVRMRAVMPPAPPVISASQSSSCAAGRALSAGIAPTMPALHCSITSLGVADDEQRQPIPAAATGEDGKRHVAGLRVGRSERFDGQAVAFSRQGLRRWRRGCQAPWRGCARRRSARWRSWP